MPPSSALSPRCHDRFQREKKGAQDGTGRDIPYLYCWEYHPMKDVSGYHGDHKSPK